MEFLSCRYYRVNRLDGGCCGSDGLAGFYFGVGFLDFGFVDKVLFDLDDWGIY